MSVVEGKWRSKVDGEFASPTVEFGYAIKITANNIGEPRFFNADAPADGYSGAQTWQKDLNDKVTVFGSIDAAWRAVATYATRCVELRVKHGHFKIEWDFSRYTAVAVTTHTVRKLVEVK